MGLKSLAQRAMLPLMLMNASCDNAREAEGVMKAALAKVRNGCADVLQAWEEEGRPKPTLVDEGKSMVVINSDDKGSCLRATFKNPRYGGTHLSYIEPGETGRRWTMVASTRDSRGAVIIPEGEIERVGCTIYPQDSGIARLNYRKPTSGYDDRGYREKSYDVKACEDVLGEIDDSIAHFNETVGIF